MTDEAQVNPGRVYIRAVTRKDRSEFLQLMQISQALHEPWITPPCTELSFHNYLNRAAREDHEFVDKAGDPVDLIDDQLGCFLPAFIDRRQSEKFCCASNPAEGILYFVGDTGGDMAVGFVSFVLADLFSKGSSRAAIPNGDREAATLRSAEMSVTEE